MLLDGVEGVVADQVTVDQFLADPLGVSVRWSEVTEVRSLKATAKAILCSVSSKHPKLSPNRSVKGDNQKINE